VTSAAELDPLRLLCPGSQHRPALEVLAVRIPTERKEMVPREDHVDSGFLSRSHRPPQVRVIGVLGLQLHSDPDCGRRTAIRTLAS
jgi:hypothetical protein